MHVNINILNTTEVIELRQSEQGWQVQGRQGLIAEAPVVVMAGANDCALFPQTAHLPLEPVRGQISQLPASPASGMLKAVVCTEGYISPAYLGQHCAGATFIAEDRALDLRRADHVQNLAMLAHMSAPLYQALGGDALDPDRLQGRVALRSATPDYLPMAGPLLEASTVLARYSEGSRSGSQHLPWLNGLYINTGHGSKGLLTAPLCAEIIAAMLENEPLPVDVGLLRALDPNRFLLRGRGLKRLIGARVG
jgi:tRNA 5-methylaminomethyl-2-thiouridine biosynthesis bifunctional protein